MALAKGYSKIRCGPLSDHTKTAINVAELLTKVSFNNNMYIYYFFLIFKKVKFTITEIPSSKIGGDESNSTISQAAASASNTLNSATIIECEGLGHQRRS